MALQCGIVGLPNVGKSTLFNCLSNAKAQSANFPFCTIEPNVGVITVPDTPVLQPKCAIIFLWILFRKNIFFLRIKKLNLDVFSLLLICRIIYL